jgi:hypothetical protein
VRWWDLAARRRRVYWQVVVRDTACLVGLEGGAAFVEAVYD